MSFSRRPLCAVFVTLLSLHSAAGENVPQLAGDATADSIVQAALQAEVEGDVTQRNALLLDALQLDPNHAAARWHSGHVRIDDQWLSVEEAEGMVSEKGLADTYRELRDRHSGDLAGELSLARWCRQNGLEDQERLHWTGVIRLDPNHSEARTRLGLREFRGLLLTAEQIENWKSGMREYQRAMEHWDSTLGRWRREIESSSLPHLTDSWQQLTNLNDPAAVPSLEKLIRRSDLQFKRKAISVLGKIDGQVASDALIRLALNGDSAEIRHAAASQLADRSWFGFVPNLLSRLETPVEYRYAMKTLGSSVFSQIQFSKEDSAAIVNYSQTKNAYFPIEISNTPRSRLQRINAELSASIRQQQLVAREANRQYLQIAEAVRAVENANAKRGMFNERIFAALRTSTGQRIDSRSQSWWDWWTEYNERDNSEEKPEYDYRYHRYYKNSVRVPKMSCFLAGTLVWTETGPVAIENVRRGDRVLSQHPLSGELSYRTVIETTIRPPSPTLQIQMSGEQLEATRGHPIWVVGRGWKMAKELQAGDRLHGVAGSVTVDKIEAGPTAQAFNLVVAESNNYFVGKHRVLVHDNQPQMAIDIPLPGWDFASRVAD